MKLGEAVTRETIVVLAGAVLAAWIIGNVPELRDWIARQWGAAKGGTRCSC